MKGKFKLLLIASLMSLNGFAQDADSTKFEAGIALNRYVPVRENENLPYFFSGSIRYNFKSTAKFNHLINVRVAGNYNRQVSIKPLAAKRYICFEAGYHGRWKRDSTNWRIAWGVNARVFQINETVATIHRSYA